MTKYICILLTLTMLTLGLYHINKALVAVSIQPKQVTSIENHAIQCDEEIYVITIPTTAPKEMYEAYASGYCQAMETLQ